MGSENLAGYRRRLKQLIYSIGRLYAIEPRTSTDGTELCRVLQGYDIPTTLGKINKFGDDPAQIVLEYLLASNSLKGSATRGRFYLSIKPPALNFDPELAAIIAATALENGHGVHFDSHEFSQTDATLQLIEDLLERELPANTPAGSWRFSLTIPSRWKRSSADARWAARKGVRVRLVKGDFKADSSDELDPVHGFLSLVDQLAGEVSDLALATHDCSLAREAIARCSRAGSALQLELFFGMPARAMMALSKEAGVPLGFYVPYGDTLLVYLIRDWLANPHKLFRTDSFAVLGKQKTKLARIVESL